MENIVIANPIDPSVSGGAVANSPPKAPIPPIRQRIRGPFTRYPVVNGPMSRLAKPTVPARPLVRQKIVGPVSKPPLNPISSIEAELAEVRRAWARYRSTNGRDAVYIYLTAVFRLVMRWRRLNRAVKNSRAALRLQPNGPEFKPEPFGIVIFCTSDPEVSDSKTRSKWSRVLRYARKAKPAKHSETKD
jgi:hypothetical protein